MLATVAHVIAQLAAQVSHLIAFIIVPAGVDCRRSAKLATRLSKTTTMIASDGFADLGTGAGSRLTPGARSAANLR